MEIKQPVFGKRLRNIRLRNRLAQADLAGGPISTSYISRIESGSRVPSEEAVRHVASKLGVSLEELLSTDNTDATMAEVSTALADHDFPTVIDLLQSYGPNLLERLPEGWAWQALWARFHAHSGTNDYAAQSADLQQMVALARKWESPSLLSRLLIEMSKTERTLGNIGGALGAAREAHSVAIGLHSRSDVLMLKSWLALVTTETEAGLLPQASARIPDVLRAAETAASSLQAHAYWTCSSVRIRQGMFQEGKELIDRALAAMESRDDLLDWARLRVAAVSLHLRVPELVSPSIRTWLKEAADAFHYVGQPIHHAELNAVAARVDLTEGKLPEALAKAAAAEDTGLLAFHDRLRTRLLRAEVTIRMGQIEQGLLLAQSVAEEADGSGYLDLAAEAWRTVATSKNLPPAI
ncbi:helix-turn-helix domain-containing protein [Streptomyces beigongshangae]|uniref:helix-turn-helix domain-containing protein n=1 Tax=Streptomyces beigongshangae TaxID=2841597 RepID=UPI001C84434A|nr:helix-turn-helix transcriptional regulator [Streptomyces sp. REN17]